MWIMFHDWCVHIRFEFMKLRQVFLPLIIIQTWHDVYAWAISMVFWYISMSICDGWNGCACAYSKHFANYLSTNWKESYIYIYECSCSVFFFARKCVLRIYDFDVELFENVQRCGVSFDYFRHILMKIMRVVGWFLLRIVKIFLLQNKAQCASEGCREWDVFDTKITSMLGVS